MGGTGQWPVPSGDPPDGTETGVQIGRVARSTHFSDNLSMRSGCRPARLGSFCSLGLLKSRKQPAERQGDRECSALEPVVQVAG